MALITLREVSDRTGLSVDTLRRYIKAGRLPASRRGPKILVVEEADVDALTKRV
ncbi:helix-turn-helix transcriptional regulator [Rhodococcus sp. NPDC004095]